MQNVSDGLPQACCALASSFKCGTPAELVLGALAARPEARGKLLVGDLAGRWCVEGACACAQSVNDGLLECLWRAGEPSLCAADTPAELTASAHGGGEKIMRRAAAAKLDAGRLGCLGLWAGR